MKAINWNQMSELGLIEKINTEILHPLGLAISRNTKTGCSENVLISDDGAWEYDPKMKTTIISDVQVKAKLSEMADRHLPVLGSELLHINSNHTRVKVIYLDEEVGGVVVENISGTVSGIWNDADYLLCKPSELMLPSDE